VTLLAGTVVSALVFGAFLRDFSPARLVQVIQAAAVLTLLLNTIALWKQETRRPAHRFAPTEAPGFAQAWRSLMQGEGARSRLLAIGLGTLAFGMQDVLIEPYGGQVLGMGVGETTWLTAALAAGGLAGFALASSILAHGADPARMALAGAVVGVPAFAAVLVSASLQSVGVFACGVLLVGVGAGLFGHGTLTLTMNRAPREQVGLALGAWGAVQATAAGVAVAAGGLLRDGVSLLAQQRVFGESLAHPTTGYAAVYLLEIVLLVATIVVLAALVAPAGRAASPALSLDPH
jgi:BCD family chlorophyll transporter-like MFS transporter